MPHRDKSEFQGRQGSLLSLGDALREEETPAPSRLARAIADVRAEKDAVTRHRLARARREGREAPQSGALKTAPASPPSAPPPASRQQAPDRPVPPVSRAAPERPADKPRAPRADEEKDEARSAVAPASAAPFDTGPEPVKAAPAAGTALPSRPARAGPSTPPVEPAAVRDAGEPSGFWLPLVDPVTVLSGIARAKRLILFTTLLGAILGVLVAMNTPKRYLAEAELLADPRDLNLVDRELTQTGLSNEATLAIVENQVRILTSGTVLAKVVEKLNLVDDPEFNGQGGGFGPRAIVDAIRSSFSPQHGLDEPGRRHALAVNNLGRALSIERSGKTFVIVVGVTTRSAEKSALIANSMTEVFLQSYGQIQSDAAGRAAGELTGKLDELRAGVEAAERKVEAFKAQNDLIDAQGRLITDEEILKLNDQLSTARARALELNARAASTRGASADAVLGGALPEELSSPTMQELLAQYSQLKGEVDRLSTRLGPRHPQLQAVQSQISGARGLIDAEIRRIAAATQTELKRAVQLEQELSSRLAQLKVRQGNLSNEMVTLRELERGATAQRAVYEAYLLRARETGEQQGINAANISVISKAFPPLEALPPSRSTIVLAGTVLGLLAGIGIGGVRGTMEGLRQTVRRRRPAVAWRATPTATMFSPDDGAKAGFDTRRAGEHVEARGSSPPAEAELDAGRFPPAEPVQPADRAGYEYPPIQPAPSYAAQRLPPAEPDAAAPANAWPIAAPAGHSPQAPQTQYPSPYVYERSEPVPSAPTPRSGQAAHWTESSFREPANYAFPEPEPGDAYPYEYPPITNPRHVPLERSQRPVDPAPRRASADAQLSIEEIQSNLRELREAIRELTETRTRRRYF